MNRRDFLRLSGAAVGMLASASVPALGAPRRKPTIVVFTDITPDVPLPRFAAMLGTMLAQGLPVTCIVQTRTADGKMLTPDSELAVLLRSFLRTAPGVIEIAAHVNELANSTAFEQSRLAYRARKELIEALFPSDSAESAGPLIQSIASDFSNGSVSPVGVRSAGIRNVLVLPKNSSVVSSEYWDTGVLRLTGGVHADLFGAIEHLGGLSPKQFQNVILLSVRENMNRSEHVVRAAAKVFSNVALQYEADQWISNLRLADLQLRDGYFRFERRIGLHLFEPMPDQAELTDGFALFQSTLRRDGIEFSTGANILGTRQTGENLGYWIETETNPVHPVAESGDPETVVNLGCINGAPEPDLGPDRFLNAGVGLVLDTRGGGIQGLDDCGRIHIPTIDVPPLIKPRLQTLSGTAGVNDFILTVAPELTVTPAQRNILRGELKKLTGDWITKIVPVANLVKPILPQTPLISLYRQTEVYAARTQPTIKPLTASERDTLLEDAVTAWTYFYRFTNKTTGLCPATVYYSGGTKSAVNSATMWDVASHINALIAAVDIGLIKEREFRRSIAKILANIAGRPSGGRQLPSEWIKTNRFNSGNKNFDGCDTGRLLAALYNLREHRFADEKIEHLVEKWTLDQVIKDKRIMSLADGELRSTYSSHCAHYSALAFEKWNFEVDSPYRVFEGTPNSDDKMALLEVAARFGPIGAEPLLLEAMDFGISTQSAYLADVLFGAQVREFDISGDLICVSEGPIDRAPWFTYQGLQMIAPDRTWIVNTDRDDKEYRSAKFQREFRVTSTKAAFLWAAQRPQDFSRALLEYARKHGRTPIGFASSIYSQTDEPTKNYTDINTNGIILQAVSNMLSADSNTG